MFFEPIFLKLFFPLHFSTQHILTFLKNILGPNIFVVFFSKYFLTQYFFSFFSKCFLSKYFFKVFFLLHFSTRHFDFFYKIFFDFFKMFFLIFFDFIFFILLFSMTFFDQANILQNISGPIFYIYFDLFLFFKIKIWPNIFFCPWHFTPQHILTISFFFFFKI